MANEVLMFFRSKRKTAQDIYISDPIDTDKEGNSLTLMDIVADEDNILDNLDLKIKSEKLHKFIETHLDEREKTIVLMRYGLCGYLPMTQREVAKKLGISRSYVSRIEKKALCTLKKQFVREGI
ncbi:sigma-70 family RNA polymerase sigma factor [Hydrogenoanaerobacterium saccharovorans]|uniref:sigma-70 family RNA polymerase sigma factor n=1 Tax=Hydrogenoanaerobacterium saccharovorans TaxID=474960 RepID=UPI00241C9E60|nr:sigma-70 family RNA polymerase sigma factor [Hydrogenoanaerobacterium saccharovorans]